MQHKTRNELETVARIVPSSLRPVMTRDQRLARWAELLERTPDRLLGSLPGTEYQPVHVRAKMRGGDSPISVAFEDTVLRDEGLENDTYGEAKRFFELTDWQLHEIVCYCHFGTTMTAETAARCVRNAMGEHGKQGWFEGRSWAVIS